jgi:hypothetical protein
MKRETLFAVLSLEDIQTIRELVSFRARITTIAQLVPHQYAAKAARTMYQVSGGRAPGGSPSPCNQILVTVYRSLTLKVTLNALYNEFLDMRIAGVGFEASLISVYRSYRKRVGWPSDENQTISFDHWCVVAWEIETRASRSMRCSVCSSRNLLTKHTSAAIDCIFCDLLAASSKSAPEGRDMAPLPVRKSA